MRLVRWGEARAMPWKNGGGVTHEIAVHPEGAGLDDFDWRISMAEVASDGPFSRFSGVDRTLCLLAGAGIVLDFADGPQVVVDPDADPHAFPGEAEVTGTLIDGPILDLNIMTRRGVADHRASRIAVTGPTPIAIAHTAAVVCRDGTLRIADTDIVLASRDGLLIGPDTKVVTLNGHGTAFITMIG